MIFSGVLFARVGGILGLYVMGLPFTIGATFEPNLGLIPRHFAHAAEYLHCEMVSSDGRGRGREAETTARVSPIPNIPDGPMTECKSVGEADI